MAIDGGQLRAFLVAVLVLSFVPCFAVLLSALFAARVEPPGHQGQHTKNGVSCDTLLVKLGDLGAVATQWGPNVSCCPLVAKGL